MTDDKGARRRPGAAKPDEAWTDDERAAIEEYRRDRRRAARPGGRKDEPDGEAEVLAKIAAMDEPDHTIAQRFHAIVKEAAPELVSRTWYGSPAYYRNGQLVCFLQERAKFKARYVVLGFSDKAHLDDGSMWPISFALTDLTPAIGARITELVKKAVA